jgi:hypothetical protein
MHPLKKYLQASNRTRREIAAAVGTSPLYLTHIMAYRKHPGETLTESLMLDTGLSYEDFHPDRAKHLERVKEIESGSR